MGLLMANKLFDNFDSDSVLKYGAPDLSSEVRQYESEKRDRQHETAKRAAAIRQRIALTLHNIARERRAQYDKEVYPFEQQVLRKATEGFTPDYEQVGDQAISDVGGAYDRQAAADERYQRGYGIERNDPGAQRRTEMDETANKVFAANTAVRYARDRSDVLNNQRRQQAYALVRGVPTQVGGAFSYGGESKAGAIEGQGRIQDIYDQDTSGLATGAGYVTGQYYKDGGDVDGIDLNDSDYIIPADVVQKLGTEFFDKLMKENSEDDHG